MKKQLLHIVFIVTLCFQSCSDFLEVDPQNVQTSDVQFSTLEGQKQVLSRAYYDLEGLYSSVYFIYPELIGGNSAIAPNPSTAGSNSGIITVPSIITKSYNYNNVSQDSDFNGFYENSYQVIYLVNKIIETIAAVNATENEKKQIIAEATAIRGTVHFMLLQIFAQHYGFSVTGNHPGIIYLQNTVNPAVDFPSRSSVATCYELVKQDFTNAIAQFQIVQALNGPSYAFFNKNNTKALLLRVLLEKKEWNNTITLAQEVIAESGVTLMPQNLYISEWEKPELPVSEILLELTPPRDDSNNVSSSVSEYYRIINATNYGKYVASSDLFNLYENTDVRRNNFIVQSLATNVGTGSVNSNYRFTKKFQNNPGTTVLRLSEVYLLLAEAYVRNNQTTEAENALNTIRNRAGIASVQNASNLLEEIFNERRRELCFETHLLFDIARFQKPISRGADCISNCFLAYPSPKYIMPIPFTNIMLNPNLIQNESY